MGDLFEGYGATALRPKTVPAFDEMFSKPGTARTAYKDIHAALSNMTHRTDALASSYLAQGVTFDFAGEERAFPLDAVPRVIEQAEWVEVEAGIKQRVKALEAFLADVYGKQNAVRDNVIPARLITSSIHFHREAAGIEPANGVRIQVSGIDLIRDEKGGWRVLEDNVRVRPVGDYPHKLLQALRASAPEGVDDPNVVVLTPGVYNSDYFEHTLLARLMGVELVEGRDLFCSGGRVFMRTTSGPTRVDVSFASSSGSVENVKVSSRCGWMFHLRQIRPTDANEGHVPARPGCILQPVEARLAIPVAPFQNARTGQIHPVTDLNIRDPRRRGERDPRTRRHRRRHPMPPSQRLKPRQVTITQH